MTTSAKPTQLDFAARYAATRWSLLDNPEMLRDTIEGRKGIFAAVDEMAEKADLLDPLGPWMCSPEVSDARRKEIQTIKDEYTAVFGEIEEAEL